MRIRKAALDEINRHAEEGYPLEICGMMIGPLKEKVVTDVRRVPNVTKGDAATRYFMDPHTMRQVYDEVDEIGYDVIGFYHSHPDHGAYFSKTDEADAIMSAVYMVVACNQGRVEGARAFVALKDGGPTREEPIEVVTP